jgi:DNA-binding CsgD family transcriptional regulator
MLLGRQTECETLDRLLGAVRAGGSRTLVLHGEPGVGKSALLEHLTERAGDLRIARATGVRAEMGLPFAGLQQLCTGMLDRVPRLPPPQRGALATAFGLRAGDRPDRLLVGLAVLRLLADVAGEQPLLCVVDDAQWLDRPSVQAIAFAARRLAGDAVGVVLASSGDADSLAGLPVLEVEGLRNGDARALLGATTHGLLDGRIRDRIVAEARGNPLALLELPRGLTPAELAGGFGPPDAGAAHERVERSDQRRFAALSPDTRLLLLIAAAEPLGDPGTVMRAADHAGIGSDAVAPAVAAGLLDVGARVRFRRSLARSAVYRAAAPGDRRIAHRALAAATDPGVAPDQHAWHLAQAAPEPDEDVAALLEHLARRMRARGGLAEAAAFLERAAALTPEAPRRTKRVIAAARAKHVAGDPESAQWLLATAEREPLDGFQRARVELLRVRMAFASGYGEDVPSRLLACARAIEPFDVEVAREAYLDALSAAMFVGAADLAEIAAAVPAAPPAPRPVRAADLLLDGLALTITDGAGAGAPGLRRALRTFRTEERANPEAVHRLWHASRVAQLLWDDDSWLALSARHVDLARASGALTVLPLALDARLGLHVLAGELAEAATLAAEGQAVTEATGVRFPPHGELLLAAWRGREAEVTALAEAAGGDAVIARHATALLYNSLGRHEEALAVAAGSPASNGTLVELIEAAALSGKPERAAHAFRRLAETTAASGTDWALGIESRCRALLAGDRAAEPFLRAAIDHLGATRLRAELARTHLLLGESQRRQGRRGEARERLGTAYELFVAMGADGFAQRAARELVAAGGVARVRTTGRGDELTAREIQIARLACAHLSNPEIGARLFISPRTVEYHLTKIFAKLGIRSRGQLDDVLSGDLAPGCTSVDPVGEPRG